MFNDTQQQQQSSKPSQGDALGLAYFFCNIHCTTLAVFIRRGFGREALGWNAFLGMFLMLFMIGSSGDPDMFYLFWAWLVAQACQRVRTWRLLRKGAVIHSRYAGYPYWAMKMPFVRSEETAKQIVEPLMCWFGGGIICVLNHHIGLYVMAGSLTFLIRHCIERAIEEKRIERMRDARIEAEYYSEQLDRDR